MAGRFGDVITAMVTPFKEDFSLDLEGAQSLAQHLLDHGSDALEVAGTTGEGSALSHDEKDYLFRAVVAVSSHLAGERMKEMVERVQSGDVATARKINEDLAPLYKGMFVTTNPIPVKAALDIAGRSVGPPRLPLVPATPEERTKIEQ